MAAHSNPQRQPRRQAAQNAARSSAQRLQASHIDNQSLRPQLTVGNQGVQRLLRTDTHSRATADPAQATLASQAAEAAHGPGAPLPAEIQREAAQRYGHSFAVQTSESRIRSQYAIDPDHGEVRARRQVSDRGSTHLDNGSRKDQT